MDLYFEFQNKLIAGKERPLPILTRSQMAFNNDLIDVNVRSGDLGPNILGIYIKVFKGLFLTALAPFMDAGGFAAIANTQITNIATQQQGQLKMGVFQMLLSMLPENDIVIPPSVGIDYSGLAGSQPVIANGRLSGYFEGTVEGMSARDAIRNATYMANGNLNLDSEASPFSYQVSSSLINTML
jgi:hypothetical protein